MYLRTRMGTHASGNTYQTDQVKNFLGIFLCLPWSSMITLCEWHLELAHLCQGSARKIVNLVSHKHRKYNIPLFLKVLPESTKQKVRQLNLIHNKQVTLLVALLPILLLLHQIAHHIKFHFYNHVNIIITTGKINWKINSPPILHFASNRKEWRVN